MTTTEPTEALIVQQGKGEVARAMSVDELRQNLNFIKTVMQTVMSEGQDYGKIPGCGEKPCLLQPGAQKLLMTFQLDEFVKKETLREYPNWHREYEFTVAVRSRIGREWDGVGTCSSLESKYRYRKAERKCPKCGQAAIIKGKAEYGGGWVCFHKKGGCGAKFADDDAAITGQAGGAIENENPADTWNTVRKMAFKRALVAAAINATNTSELWTQDVEEMAENAAVVGEAQAAPQAKPAPAAAPAKPPTVDPAKLRERMIAVLTEHKLEDAARAFAEQSGWIMPNETLADVPDNHVPRTKAAMDDLRAAIGRFVDSGEVPSAPDPADQVPGAEVTEAPNEWFMGIIVPVPRKGQKRDEYLKQPDTIGSLYKARHGDDEEAQAARQRLWGFVNHFEAKPWVKKDGTKMPPSTVDLKFRDALDAFQEWFEKNHPDEKL